MESIPRLVVSVIVIGSGLERRGRAAMAGRGRGVSGASGGRGRRRAGSRTGSWGTAR